MRIFKPRQERCFIEAGRYDLQAVVGIEQMKTVSAAEGGAFLGTAAWYEQEADGTRDRLRAENATTVDYLHRYSPDRYYDVCSSATQRARHPVLGTWGESTITECDSGKL